MCIRDRDSYEGWMTATQLEQVNEETAITNHAFVTSDLLNRIEVGENKMNVPIGSTLPDFDGTKGAFGSVHFKYAGVSMKRNELFPSEELLRQLTFRWLNTPYLWGGRTI